MKKTRSGLFLLYLKIRKSADSLRGTKHFGNESCGTLRTEDTQDAVKL